MNTLMISVKQRRILGANKKDLWIFYSILIWLGLTMSLFFAFLATDIIVLFLVFVVSFFSIIPLFIVNYKKTAKFRGEKAFFMEEVTFRIEGGELYAGETKITNIQHDRKMKCVYVNDIQQVKTEVKGIPISSEKASFIGIVEEEYLNMFLSFLRENGISVR